MINPAGVCARNVYRNNLNFRKKTGAVSAGAVRAADGYVPVINSPVNFRGAPYKLDLSLLGVPEKGSLTAKEAIKVFEKFKLGNYLDIGDDKLDFAKNLAVRKQNLSFLNRVGGETEKKEFINYYKKLTGFPNLKEVSEKIKIEFVQTLMKVTEKLNGSTNSRRFDVIQAGYDGICSVGRHKALPGSDLDKAYVIIKGYGDIKYDSYAVRDFKWKLWDYTDQRILSYNHDAAAFPQVYTEAQFKALLTKADEKCQNFNLREKKRYWLDAIVDPFGVPLYLEKDTPRYEQLKELQNTYTEDYVAANKFYIELCKQFPYGVYGDNEFIAPNKEAMKNIGFVIETLREGVYFTKFGKMNYFDLRDSVTFNLTNLSQLKALKNRGDKKPKRLARMELEKDFDTWDVDKQYRMVKTLIESACSNNTNFTDEFPQYFSRTGKDLFEPLIKALIK